MSSSKKSPQEAERSNQRATALEAVLAVGGSAIFLFLLYALREVLNPLILSVSVMLTLWPLRSHTPIKAILTTTVFLLLTWLIYKSRIVLAPFVFAYIVAYAVAPIVTRLRERFRIPRWVSALTLMVVLVSLVTLGVVLLAPRLIVQIQELAGGFLDLASTMPDRIASSTFFQQLESMGVVSRQSLEERLSTAVSDNVSVLLERVPSVIRGTLESINTLIGWITILAVVPVVMFYMIRDWDIINERLTAILPTLSGRRPYLARIDEVVGNYLRGQLLISLIAAVNVTFWFTIFDVPYSLLLGVLAGVLNMIPQVGALLTNILAAIVVLAFGDPVLVKLVVVEVVLLGQALLEQTILTPHIMSTQVGLHPVLIIVVLFVFAAFLGFFGFLIAVPATALIVVTYDTYRERLQFDLHTYGRPPDGDG